MNSMTESKRAYTLKADGNCIELCHQPTLKEAQNIVGGYIEYVKSTLSPNKTLIVNEDGLALRLPFNPGASELYIHSPIVGDVIILEGWEGVLP